MQRALSLLAVGALALLVGSTAFAKSGTEKFSGTISRIDAAGKTFAVKHGDQELTFQLAADARIMTGARPGSLRTLAIGESVVVTYTDEGSSHVAQRVEVAKAKHDKKPQATAPGSGASD